MVLRVRSCPILTFSHTDSDTTTTSTSSDVTDTVRNLTNIWFTISLSLTLHSWLCVVIANRFVSATY